VLTDVSEELIASFFRVEDKKKYVSEPAWAGATDRRSSETSVNIISTRRHIPEDCFLHSHRPENLKPYNIKMELREIGWDGMDWIDLAQDMDQWMALVNLRVP
jgi:hypothetical protein